MKRLHDLLNRNVISNNRILLLFQSAAYATSAGVFAACLFTTVRFATTPFDVFIGLIASSILAIGLITLAAIMPLTLGFPSAHRAEISENAG